MRLERFGGALALAIWLSACATPAPPPVPTPSPAAPAWTPPSSPADTTRPSEGPRPYYPEPPRGQRVSDLPGWEEEDHRAAFRAYAQGCGAARDEPSRTVCERARAWSTSGPPNAEEARLFLERSFTVERVGGEGLMTSYFAPEYPARRRRDAEFEAPILGRPDDLARGPVANGRVSYRRRTPSGDLVAYPDRAAIEREGAPAPVLGWMRAEDLFFLQIQGSGYLSFEDGTHARAAYAADNGRPFVGIARPMAEQGLLPRDGTSGEAISTWLGQHRGPEAMRIMALNPRYIFFELQPDDGGHPAGAAGVPLTPGRAIAVDPAYWRYGEAAWIDAGAGNLIGARRGYRGLAMALDTGSAIKGQVRADYYMGRGEAAGEEAGTVRHPLRMWRLVPRP